MKRTLLLIGLTVAGCLSMGIALADTAPTAPSPVVLGAPATPAPLALGASTAPDMDPYLGGELKTQVPSALRCRDEIPSVCESLPNGDKCDTPKGCVCGWSGGQRACGRF